MDENEIKNIIESLIDTFLMAGDVSIQLRNQGLKKEIKSDNTPVSNGDLKANEIITNKILQLTPNLPIISEETVNLKVKNKSKKVYEANITVFDALKKSDYDKKGIFYLERYISAHAIMISFEGIPAIYFNSMFGTSNDEAKYVITGNNRDINRYKWNKENLLSKLKDNKSKEKIFYKNIVKLLEIKKKQKAFHPNAHRSILILVQKYIVLKE